MTPTELENTINDTFGDNTISISKEDENNVLISFECTGEPKVYAIRNIKELTSVDDSWEYKSGLPTDDVWTYEYN